MASPQGMTGEYLRGLKEALDLAYAKPTAFAFSVAAEIKKLVDAEESRLAEIDKRNERTRRALAPRAPWRDHNKD